jgi:GNAT superfamily N-acetyltransferase
MPRITDLLYLERDTKTPLAMQVEVNPQTSSTSVNATGAGSGCMKARGTLRPYPPELTWRAFDPSREAEFRALLQATYASSLDMPELEGVRSLDDIIEGHRAAGRFIPGRWQLGQIPGHPEIAVVLLLSDVSDRDAWEVVYLGLTPAARGRGLGRAAIAHALELARCHVSRLELAVDVRNLPATRLYETTGFVPFDRRSVHLVVFPENA